MTVSVGIVGAGAIARKMHLPVLLSMSDVRVDWLYDRDPDRARDLGKAYGVPVVQAASPAQLPQSDVVLLAIPVEARHEYFETVARQGGSVFCEKPFALTAAEHRRVAALYADSRVACGYMRRFYDSVLTLRQVVAEGWFGPLTRLRIAEGNRSRASGADTSFLDGSGSGAACGVLTDLGSHSIDLALHLTQASSFRIRECEMVFDGPIDRRVAARVDLIGAPAGDWSRGTGAAVAVTSPAGSGDVPSGDSVEFEYEVSWLDVQPNRLELQFERATVFCGLGWNAEVLVGQPEKPAQAFRLLAPVQGARTPNQAFYLEWRAFLEGLAGERESAISANSAYLTTALVESLHEWGRHAHD
jgi:predicted dehydrogenase